MENKLKELEQESISIIRNTIKQSSKPVILYSESDGNSTIEISISTLSSIIFVM